MFDISDEIITVIHQNTLVPGQLFSSFFIHGVDMSVHIPSLVHFTTLQILYFIRCHFFILLLKIILQTFFDNEIIDFNFILLTIITYDLIKKCNELNYKNIYIMCIMIF